MPTTTLRIGASTLLATSLLVVASLQGQAPTPTIAAAPRDRVVAIPKTMLARHFSDMDAKRQQTLRLLEGGKYNVNIRRITNAETALVHPNTVDLWVVLDGGGTLTTGGRIENGKIVGGSSHPLKVGDVEFIPVDVPHGVSGVNGTITWLNVRWDIDWPAGAPLGAGELPARGGAPAAPGRLTPIAFAQPGHVVTIRREKLDAYRGELEAKKTTTVRMIEGGHFNVNIRRLTEPSVELHKMTIDTWVLLDGSGVVNTGFEMQNGKRVPGTGQTVRAQAGDVVFIPSGLSHGFSAIDGSVSWLNIRWDDNYGK